MRAQREGRGGGQGELGGWLRLLALAGVLLGAAGCPRTGPDCAEGLTPCEGACVDLRTSREACGACGVACGAAEVCQAGACECREGAALCGGACRDLRADAQHCGACGVACAAGEACDRGACRPVLRCGGAECVGATACAGDACVCPAGTRLCGSACVELASDVDHCGACGRACEDVQACRGGACTYELVAACQLTSQLVGVRASGQVGPPVPLPGPMLQSLAADGDAILVGETDGELRLVARDGLVPRAAPLLAAGASPNHFLVDPPHVYLVESLETNSLLVLRREEGPQGPSYPVAGQLFLGESSSPQAVAKVGRTLFIPLLIPQPRPDGSKAFVVARVDVSDPARPVRGEDVVLPSGEALRPFPGSTSQAFPLHALVHRGAVYVTLSNLRALTSPPVAGGPGLLARLDPESGTVEVLELDPEVCLNPTDLRAVGELLAVGCMGTWETSGGRLVKPQGFGVVLLDAQGRRLASWQPRCPAGDAACERLPPVAYKVMSLGERLFVGDLNGGRLFVLEAGPGGLRELRGYAGAEGGPVLACPAAKGDAAFNNVADLVVLP